MPSAPPLRTLFAVLLLLLVPAGKGCAQGVDDTDALLDAMAIGEGDWAADVGSGDGDYTLPMAERVGPSGRVFAVDVDAGALGELNEQLVDRDVDHVTTVYSVEDNPMLPPDAFDAILVRNAYHHFTTPESMLHHLRAALRPDGRLVLQESIDRTMIGESRAAQVANHDLGIEYVRAELEAAGFTIQRAVHPQFETSWGVYWMLVATRPGSQE
jgi:ubiquinone/menaquinone biosynthesis C-methylase UbiE